MMHNPFLHYLAGAILAFSAAGAQAQADHLLLSEVGISASDQTAGFSSEYVEIHNPTNAPIDLSNYYITDHNDYKLFPVAGGVAGGNTDNVLRFPSATLQPGQYAVVTGGGKNFLEAYFGANVTYADFQNELPGSPLLFEVGETDATISNMTFFNTGGTPDNFGLTNPSDTNGEFVILFHWDGSSDLVDDVDIVTWGNDDGGNRFAPKTAADTGANGTPYLADAGSHAGLSLGNSGFELITRVSTTETGEVQTGGNGITGHDETTEQASTTWLGGNFETDETPGYSLVDLPSQRPVIATAVRDVQYPTAGQDITITASVSDPDGTISNVTVHVRTDAVFTAVAATEGDPGVWSANIGSFADGTLVDYYVEVTDNSGATAVFPKFAPMTGLLNGFHVTADPVSDGDVIVNEILHDNPGGDRFEFVELHNTLGVPLDLSYFGFADANRGFDDGNGILPRGAIIPANGYLVVTQSPNLLLENFVELPGVSYIDWGTFALNQGGDTILLAHSNEFGTAANTPAAVIEEMVYDTEAPWPAGYGGSLRSMELKHPTLDNTLPGSWAEAIELATPGAQNSVFSEGAVITNVTRDVKFPAPNTPITISAVVIHPLEGATVQAVRVLVDTGSGTYTPVPMTANGTTYTAQLAGYPEGTVVKFFIEAEDNNAVIVTNPLTAPDDHYLFVVNADPAGSEDLVINEILYDNIGGDNYEYVEIYNRSNSEISLGHFRIGDGTSNFLAFPAGAVIAANGYVVVTMNIEALEQQYIIPPGVPVYESPFILNNPSDLVYIAHPNSVNFNGTTTLLDEVNYDNVAPWPEIEANVTGQSIELLSPELDNSLGQNWAGAVIIGPFPGSGTPGAENTAEGSNVADWNLY